MPNICTACAGSGYYDNDGSPPCGACNGTGFESDETDDDLVDDENKED